MQADAICLPGLNLIALIIAWMMGRGAIDLLLLMCPDASGTGSGSNGVPSSTCTGAKAVALPNVDGFLMRFIFSVFTLRPELLRRYANETSH